MNDYGEIYRAAMSASSQWNIWRKENSDKEIIPYKIIIWRKYAYRNNYNDKSFNLE